MKTILLASDGSEPAREAERYLIQRFSPEQARVLVVTVADPAQSDLELRSGDQGLEIPDEDEMRKRIVSNPESVAREIGERLQEAGFQVDKTVPIGEPSTEICAIAEEEDADLIVVGRRGLSEVGELLLGSVSHHIVHHAPCPVSVVPGPEDE